MIQKPFKNEAKTVPRGLQNSDGPRFWWVLAAKRPQEASKTAQEAPKRPPRPPQVAPRWPTWVQVGFQNGAQIEEKSMEKSIENVMHLGIYFWKDVGGFLEEKQAKIEEKSMKKSIEK